MQSLPTQVAVRILSEAVLAVRGIVLIPVLARTLGAAGYGAFAQIWLTAQVLTPFINLSIENAVVQRVASGAEDRNHGAVLGHALLISTVIGAGFLAAASTPLGALLARVTMSDAAMQPEFLAACVLACIGGPIAVGLGYLQGTQQIAAASALYVSRAFASAFIMIGVALAGFNLRWVMLAAIATDLGFLAILLAVVRPRLDWKSISARELRWMVAFAGPIAAGNALYLALNAVPRYLLVNAMGLAVVAAYSAIVSLATPILQVAGAVQYVVYPAAAHQQTHAGANRAAGLVARSITAVLCFGSVALVGLCFLGPALLSALTGGRMTGTPSVFCAVGYGMVLLGVYRIVVISQLTTGDSRRLLAPLAISAATVAFASVVLVPLAAETGAAFAYLLGCASLLVAVAWQLKASSLSRALTGYRGLTLRAGIALLIPAAGLLLPAAPLALACAYAAAGLGAVGFVWLGFGGVRLLREAIAAGPSDRPGDASPRTSG